MWHNIELTIYHKKTFFRCHITQKLSNNLIGHYCGYINDSNNHTVGIIQSTGSPKDQLRIEEAREICHHIIDRLEE